MNYKKIFKRETKVMVYIIFALTIVLIGSSYALFLKVGKNTKNQVVEAGSLSITYSNGNPVSATDASKCLIPQSDTDGKGSGGCLFEFTIENKGTLPSEYRLLIYNDSTTTDSLDNQYIKYNLQRKLNPDSVEVVNIGEENTLSELPKEEEKRILTTNTIGVNESITFYLKIWISETAPGVGEDNSIVGKKVNLKIDVENLVDENIALKNFSEMATYASTDENICPLSNIVAVNHSDATIENAGYDDSATAISNLKQTEYRYCGADPNNYVTFNDELWRIIGFVNTPEGQRIKLIRSDSLNETKAWDENSINDWTKASLQEYLNGEYLNSLKKSFQDMIDNITWNLGGYNTVRTTTNQYYDYERGTTVYNERSKLWKGQIGLIYPSDYGYATSGGSTHNRESCLVKILYDWKNTDTNALYQIDCAYNDWLLKKDNWQWTLMPSSSTSNSAYDVLNTGSVDGKPVSNMSVVMPSLYLKLNVQIASGTGSSNDPYTLKLES